MSLDVIRAAPGARLRVLHASAWVRLMGQRLQWFQGLLVPFVISAGLALFFSWRVDANLFGLHMFYRNRLVRCYLGASNERRAHHPFTGFDEADSVALKCLRQRPYHLVNGALNITRGTRLAWQERKAASFIASPLFSGYDLRDDTRSGMSSRRRSGRESSISGSSSSFASACRGACPSTRSICSG